MGFFGIDNRAPKSPARTPGAQNVQMLHKTECKSCPLNRADCRSPKMQPEGVREPLIYLLGTAPNDSADRMDVPFAGPELRLIKQAMPREAFAVTRLNNTIRTHPGMDPKEVEHLNKDADPLFQVRLPTFVETECCRPSIIRDIEEARPDAIFTFGGPALKWVNGETHANLWQGRRMPVRIGTHECWLYPFQAPVDILKQRKWEGMESDDEFAFKFYMRKACDEILSGDLPAPRIHSLKEIMAGLETFDGSGGDRDLDAIEDFLLAEDDDVQGYDIETNKLRPYNSDAKLLSFAVSRFDQTYSIAVEHKDAKWTPQQLRRLHKLHYKWLMLRLPRKAVHQLAFEMEWAGVFYGAEVIRAGGWVDTISQAYIINETQGLLALENLTVQHFGFNIKNLNPVDRRNLENEPLSRLLLYNGLDAKYHKELALEQMPIIREQDLEEQYAHQLARIPSLVLTQMQGIPIDQEEVKEFRREYDEEIALCEAELAKLPSVKKFAEINGEAYSPSNTHHMAKILRQLGHKLSKTEKGGDKTDAKAIGKYKDKVVEYTIRHRKAAKLLATYIDAVTPGSEYLFEDGLAHPIISTTKVTTWRTSSEDPNIQNWPKRSVAAKIRKCVKHETKKVVSFDYAGIQGRNVAMESKDRRLTQYFIDGYDIHSDWLTKMDKLAPDWTPLNAHKDAKIWKAARNGIKNQFVFPSFFGAAAKEKMAEGLAVFGRCVPSVKAIGELQEWFYEEFPDIAGWHKDLHAFYEANGYVTGCSGHRRHAPVAHNQIINAPIQADEAIIVLSAMNALSELDYTKYQPAMEIHDDLTFLWHSRDIDKYAEIVCREMTKVRFDWVNPLPLEIEMSIGDDWFSTKEVAKFKNNPKGEGFVQL